MFRSRWFLGVLVVAQVACGGGDGGEGGAGGGGSACDEDNPDKQFYRDADTDGFGDPADSLARCEPPAGYVDNDLDCDDTDERVNPETPWHPDLDGDGAGDAEVAVTQCVAPKDHVLDGEDCDDADADLGPTTAWYVDADGDGFGDPQSESKKCEGGKGEVRNAEDCDDSDVNIHPETIWYEDEDLDGWGASAFPQKQCEKPPGAVLEAGDCDDSDPILSPETVWHADADGDGAGDPTSTQTVCIQPAGHVLDGADCDDEDDQIYPGLGACPFDLGGKSCKDVLESGNSKGDGAYLVDPDGLAGDPPLTVFCDMTTDGGGWTALLNPSDKGMPTPTLPGLTYKGDVLSGSDSCPGTSVLVSHYGWYGVHFVRCGDMTIRTTLSWENDLGATDLMFTAVLEGYNTSTITADGIEIPEDAFTIDAGGGRCGFYNGTDSSVVPPVATCHDTVIDAAPAVHNGAFVGDVDLEITTGAACQPTCQYSTGHTIHKLFAR